MPTQPYGLTGRTRKPDYVGAIEAMRPYLAYKKEQKDLADYRAKTLALQEDRIKAEKEASDRASLIGIGKLGLDAYLGRKRDTAIKSMLSDSGTGGVAKEAAIKPSISSYTGGDVGADVTTPAEPDGFMTGLKSGASNWGTIAGSALGGGAIGGKLAGKFIDDSPVVRGLGGATAAGGLAYLASGDPYTAGISAIFGGIAGGLFG